MLSYVILLLLLIVLIGTFSGAHTFTRYIALAFDVFCNVLTGGSTDMTISARAGCAAINGEKWGIYLSWFLDKLEKNHCKMAIVNDINRAKAVIEKLEPYTK